MKNFGYFLVVLVFVEVPAFSQVDAEKNANFVSYCSLFETGEYDGARVRSKAKIYVPASGETQVDIGDSYFFSNGCNNRDFFPLRTF